MQSPSGNAEGQPSSLSQPYPEFCSVFLVELRLIVRRDGKPNVELAADLAGVSRRRLYRYRERSRWRQFREEWDSICRVTHSPK